MLNCHVQDALLWHAPGKGLTQHQCSMSFAPRLPVLVAQSMLQAEATTWQPRVPECKMCAMERALMLLLTLILRTSSSDEGQYAWCTSPCQWQTGKQPSGLREDGDQLGTVILWNRRGKFCAGSDQGSSSNLCMEAPFGCASYDSAARCDSAPRCPGLAQSFQRKLRRGIVSNCA
jgi:hypothetical protein